jgi:hypothetical protein
MSRFGVPGAWAGRPRVTALAQMIMEIRPVEGHISIEIIKLSPLADGARASNNLAYVN